MFLVSVQNISEKLFSVWPIVGSKAGEYAGIAIACIIAVNGLATFFFIGYYAFNGNGSDTVNRNGNLKNGRNKIRLNKKFPRLQKMLPCLNDTKGKF